MKVHGIDVAEDVGKNSLCYWFPEIKDRFPTPETWIWEPEGENPYRIVFKWLDKGPSPEVIKSMKALVRDKLPVFIRTDQSSNKHEWNKSCIINELGELASRVYNTLDYNCMVDLSPCAIVFRELLTGMKSFKVYDGMPVNREVRLFYVGGRVACVHRYWGREVFQNDEWAVRTIPNDFETQFRLLYDLRDLNLSELIQQVESNFPDKLKSDDWSVDLMWAHNSKNGEMRWFLTDAALAKDSAHYSHESDLLWPENVNIGSVGRTTEKENQDD